MLFCDTCGQLIDPDRLKTDDNLNIFCSMVCKDIAQKFIETEKAEKEETYADRNL